jgi:AAA15 family ATPase/GTPase
MLLEFRAQNFKSLRASQTLSLVASDRDKDTLPQNTLTASAPGMEEMRMLKAAAIYGANASGKSNLIQALNYLRSFVLNSARLLSPKQPTGVVPFISEKDAVQQPTELEVDFVHLDTHYRFKVVLTSNQVLEEVLEVYPDGRKQTWYRRFWDAESGTFRYEPTQSSVFKRDPKQEEFTRPNALFLSTAVQLNNEQLQPVVDWFRTQLRFSVKFGSAPNFISTARCLEAGYPLANRLRKLMKSADFGIAETRVWKEQVEFEEEDEGSGEVHFFKQERTRVNFRHAGLGGAEFELPLEDESAGTREFFTLAGPWLQALDQGVTLVLDEFDTNLHPFLTQALLELVFKPEHNPKGAQVIFTTHNPLLLDPTFLRRDQIWFVDKDTESGSFVYPLTDYKPRREESLLRGYLSGRYGALPFIPRGLMDSEPEKPPAKGGAHGC